MGWDYGYRSFLKKVLSKYGIVRCYAVLSYHEDNMLNLAMIVRVTPFYRTMKIMLDLAMIVRRYAVLS